MKSKVQGPGSGWRLCLSLLLVLAARGAELPDGNALLRRVDANAVSGNKVVVGEMLIHGRRGSRTIRTKSWVSGTDRSFSEYLAPERDRGTKMLKLGSQLWTYSPASDRIVLISGHMLRQSVSGSDLSYEDLLEDQTLESAYDARTTGTDTVAGRPAWRLELAAKSGAVAYQQRRLWVDKERDLVLKDERYSKGGRLLKTMEVKSVRQAAGRWLADQAVFRNVLKTGGGTEFKLDSIRFDVDIPDYIFSKAALKK